MGVEKCLPLVLLFLSSGVPSNAQTEPSTDATEAARDAADGTVKFYDVYRTLELNCSITTGDAYAWGVNGTELSKVATLAGRYELLENGGVFKLKQAQEDDFGNYTCERGGHRLAWQVRGKPHARMPANTNVVEGQKLKLQCKVVGKPHPRVTWRFRNASDTGNGSLLVADGRVRFVPGEGNVTDAALVLDEATRADAGYYTCEPEDGAAASTTLRVKDMYAALWPFLGICAEVFVLCAIILVYEKRRTKPELDDSDTDNHDQKKS